MSTEQFSYQLKLTIPFTNTREPVIAKQVLQPDPVLKPTELQIEYSTESTDLIIEFRSTSDRILRVGANSTLESLKTCVETMDEFEGNKEMVFKQV